MATRKDDILFPGVLKGWETKEDALAYIASLGDVGTGKRVMYHATTKVVLACCNLMTYRYSAKVDAFGVKDNVYIFELTEKEIPMKSQLSTYYYEWKQIQVPAMTALKEE